MRLVAVLVTLLCLCACTQQELDLEDEAQLTDHVAAIRGSWALESFTSDGEEVDVEVDVNTAKLPVLTFGDHVAGTVGCNQIESSFETPYEVVDRTLTLGEVVIEAAECGPGLMEAETALMDYALWADSGIHLTIVDGVMLWEVNDASFRFGRVP